MVGLAQLIDGLNRQYDHLCLTQQPDQTALTQPVVDRFCEQLQEVIDVRPDLEPKCTDLQEDLRRWFGEEGPMGAPTRDWLEDES